MLITIYAGKLACVTAGKSLFTLNIFKFYQKDLNLPSKQAQNAIIFGKLVSILT